MDARRYAPFALAVDFVFGEGNVLVVELDANSRGYLTQIFICRPLDIYAGKMERGVKSTSVTHPLQVSNVQSVVSRVHVHRVVRAHIVLELGLGLGWRASGARSRGRRLGAVVVFVVVPLALVAGPRVG